VQVVVVGPGVYTTDELLRNAEALGKSRLLEIQPRDDSFIFSVESTGAISAAEIFLNAIKILKKKLLALRLAEDGSALPVGDVLC
jgi:DNA-directed RNA polymerase II subunit RPB3